MQELNHLEKEGIFSGVSTTLAFQELEVKGEKQYVVTGYISTADLDSSDDIVTMECLQDMLTQIKAGSIKIDEEHETFWTGDYDITPKLRIVDAKIDAKGLWVKALLNKAHEQFKEIWGSIKSGFLDAFSIQFKPLETATKYIKGVAVRLLNKVKLINVGITGTPINESATLDKAFVKAIRACVKEKKANPAEKYIPKPKEEEDEDEEEVKSAMTLLKGKGYKIILPEDVDIIKPKEKKALSLTGTKLSTGKDYTSHNSHSTPSGEENKKMAEEKKETQSEAEVTEEAEEQSEAEAEAPVEEASEESEEKSEEEAPEAEAKDDSEVKALRKELAEVKAEMKKIQKSLAEPQLKAIQESMPTTKLNEKISPLGLIG